MLTRRSLLAAPLVLAASKARASRPYDVALVLATDVSSSIKSDEYAVQKQGIVNALTHPNMDHLFDEGRRYLFNYMEWSGRSAQAFSGWQVLEKSDDALAFASMIHNWNRSSQEGETAIAAALRASYGALTEVRGRAVKSVIDLSFDGKDNANFVRGGGPAVGGAVTVRETADMLARGDVVVNGLVLAEREGAMDTGTLEDYFREYIAGPRSFSVLVPESRHFGAMFLRKLIEEVS